MPLQRRRTSTLLPVTVLLLNLSISITATLLSLLPYLIIVAVETIVL